MNNLEEWKGKIAVVTGASSGIGAAICRDLCQHGIAVVGLARRLEKLNDLKKDILATKEDAVFHVVKCDLTCEKDVIMAFEYVNATLGGVDILVNNAGVSKPMKTLLGDLDEMRQVIDTNLIAVVSCTKKAFQSMSERDVPGYIINISSIQGYSVVSVRGHHNDPTTNLYCPSKFGLRALNTVLRHELNYLKKNKIRISNISPGLVKSEITLKYHGWGLPILEAKDVSGVVVFLLGTSPHVQIEDIIIRPTGDTF